MLSLAQHLPLQSSRIPTHEVAETTLNQVQGSMTMRVEQFRSARTALAKRYQNNYK